jgi:hypothetical protein
MVANQRKFRDGEAVLSLMRRLSCHSEERSDEESGFLRLEELPGCPKALAMITNRLDLKKKNLLPAPIINANL